MGLAVLIPGASPNTGILLTWLLVGLIAGFLANVVMRGGFEVIADIIVGMIGALIGGFLVGLFDLDNFDFVGSIIVSFIAACILIVILHAIAASTRRVVL
jgi:uncharacterized membrane protein YeaQ/YmgE (transglycosylase-associated protein family)